jgi:hypothetical protein
MNDTPEQFVKAYSEHIGHSIRYRDMNQGSSTYAGILSKVQFNQDRGVTELWIDATPPIIVTFDKFRGCLTCEHER